MKNFKLITSNFDVEYLLDILSRSRYLWNQNTLRTAHAGTAHAQVDDIWLRFNPIVDKTENEIRNGLECINYPPYEDLSPFAEDVITRIMGMCGASNIGRCLITKLEPGREIMPHIDSDAHSFHFNRIHVCLQGFDGNLFTCGNETVTMRSGELWWFNNRITHFCKNIGLEARIHMVMDIK